MAGSAGTGSGGGAAAGSAGVVGAAVAARGGGGPGGIGGTFTSGAAAEQVEAVLRLPELRYDPSSLTVLCHYLDEQLARNTYDADACTAVLQLYLLYPQCFAADVARKILVKGLMQLPGEDCALYVGMLQQQEKKKDWQPVQEVLHLFDLLQQCRFKQVWEYLRESHMQDVAAVPGLAEALRRYICDVVGAAYHAISVADLSVLLGLPANAHELDKLIVKNGWQQEDVVHLSQSKEVVRVVRVAAAPAAKDDASTAQGAGAGAAALAGGGGGGAGASSGSSSGNAAAGASLTRKNVEKYLAPENLRACMALFMR